MHDTQPPQKIVIRAPNWLGDQILAYPVEKKIILLAPLIQNQRGEFRDVIEKIRREGFVRVRLDGEIVELDKSEPIPGPIMAQSMAERPA